MNRDHERGARDMLNLQGQTTGEDGMTVPPEPMPAWAAEIIEKAEAHILRIRGRVTGFSYEEIALAFAVATVLLERVGQMVATQAETKEPTKKAK